MNEDLQDLERGVNSSLTEFKNCIGTKFDGISKRYENIEESFQKNGCDISANEVNESIMSVKDSIIDALK